MGLLSGISDAIRDYGPGAAQMGAAYQSGNEMAKQENQNSLLAMIKMQRQQVLDQQKAKADQAHMDLEKQQGTHYDAQTEALKHPPETFGAPFKGVTAPVPAMPGAASGISGAPDMPARPSQPAMFERGNRGTVNRIEGVSPLEEETWTNENVNIGGKPNVIQKSNRGNIRGLDKAPVTGQVTPYTAPVPDAFTTYDDLEPGTGRPRKMSLNTRTNERHEVGGMKTAAGGAPSGSQTSLDDMEQRLAEVKAHAVDIKNGTFTFGRADQTREGLTYGIARHNAAGDLGWQQPTTASAMDFFGLGKGKDSKRFADLMNSQRALGDDAAKVFKGRQNEESVLREIAMNQIAPDDIGNNTLIDQKLSRLANIIKLERISNPQQVQAQQGGVPASPASGGGRSGGGPPSSLNATQYQALVAKGYTDAQIRAAYPK